jgi:hypothetical protein
MYDGSSEFDRLFPSFVGFILVVREIRPLRGEGWDIVNYITIL